MTYLEQLGGLSEATYILRHSRPRLTGDLEIPSRVFSIACAATAERRTPAEGPLPPP